MKARVPGAPRRQRLSTTRREPRAATGPGIIPLADIAGRLREMAGQSAARSLPVEESPHPDTALLDLCGEALGLLVGAERRLRQTWAEMDAMAGHGLVCEIPKQAQRDVWKQRGEEADLMRAEAVRLMRRANKMKAVSAAGIYGKALVVRASATGASVLAKSLAEDLIANDVLRRSIWPAAL